MKRYLVTSAMDPEDVWGVATEDGGGTFVAWEPSDPDAEDSWITEAITNGQSLEEFRGHVRMAHFSLPR